MFVNFPITSFFCPAIPTGLQSHLLPSADFRLTHGFNAEECEDESNHCITSLNFTYGVSGLFQHIGLFVHMALLTSIAYKQI